MKNGALGRPAEDHADYRFFRAVALVTSRLTVAGLFFIVWALLFATGHRWETGIFLGSTTILLLFVSLISAMMAYLLYKRRGGVIEKGPRSAQELAGPTSDASKQHERRDEVAGDEHEGRGPPQDAHQVGPSDPGPLR